MKLHESKVSAANQYYVSNFAGNHMDLAKTDRIDVKILSEYEDEPAKSHDISKAPIFYYQAFRQHRFQISLYSP